MVSRIIDNPKFLILSTAKEIIYNDGYENLSIRTVAKKCNISVGTIYNYYPTKKELVMDLMSGYWDEYFVVLDEIINTDKDIFAKLNQIYIVLDKFIKNFKETWLMDKFYTTPEYVDSGVKKENIYMSMLTEKIKRMLSMDMSISNSKVYNRIGIDELAKFIILNIITVIQMPAINYNTFETILKELLY